MTREAEWLPTLMVVGRIYEPTNHTVCPVTFSQDHDAARRSTRALQVFQPNISIQPCLIRGCITSDTCTRLTPQSISVIASSLSHHRKSYSPSKWVSPSLQPTTTPPSTAPLRLPPPMKTVYQCQNRRLLLKTANGISGSCAKSVRRKGEGSH